MKPFRFQQFTVLQSEKVFRVGTDAVLLGVLSSVEKATEVLEVGCGTGIVSMMLAQRNSLLKCKAIDIDRNAAELAERNFRNSPYSERLIAKCENFKKIDSGKKFDLVISNPPYFEENSSEKDVNARQKKELNFEQLIGKTSEIISEEGIFSVIIPVEDAEGFCLEATENQFFLIRKINIYGIKGGKIRRNILEFSKAEHPLTEVDFYTEKNPRQYSDQYLEVTKDFHVFGKR